MEENVLTNENIEDQAARREREQFVKMTQTPIPKLIVSLGIPTTLNMMVTSLYNLADTYFVSGLGQEATGAVNVVLSLMSIIQAIGFTFGMGSGYLCHLEYRSPNFGRQGAYLHSCRYRWYSP